MKFGIAQSVNRVEDQRLITGQGRYTDDMALPGQLYGYMLRSPYAHARITALDTAPARTMPGVHAVYTVADLKAAGIGDLPCMMPLKNRDGSGRAETSRPALADGVVRYVGDPVAFVVADSLNLARDAAEAILVDYEDLPAVTGSENAAAKDAPQIWAHIPGNRAFDWEAGDHAKAEALFKQAAHVTKLKMVNNRVVVASMETRCAVAQFDKADERFTLYTPSQGTHSLKSTYAKMIFKVPEEKFRVVTGDVGGGFGMKIFVFPEPLMCLFAARDLGRPVRWSADRSEAFLCDTQGRDQVNFAELALDKDGIFLAIRHHTYADMGAYLSTFAPMIPTLAASKVVGSVYRFQAIAIRVEGFFTNSVPVDAYRGAGRPESNYLVERIVDAAAFELGIDPVELRRRNMVPPSAMPWTSAIGVTYDSGEFETVMNAGLKAADWTDFEARRLESKKRGKLRGRGMAYYLEATAAAGKEHAAIRFAKDGTVEVLVGTMSNGQGHETAYTQIVVEKLGVPPESVKIIQGDSDIIPRGGGTGGARSLYSEGIPLLQASDGVIDKGKTAAAEALDAEVGEIDFAEGIFRRRNTNRTIGLLELADRLRQKAPEATVLLDTAIDATITNGTFPNGCHVCEVDVDELTGVPEVVRYTVADDFGKILNPKIARGQVQGGVVQGIGQALYEHVVWSDTGQPLSGSFTDYTLPRADNLPGIDVVFCEIPCLTNPLGVKGAGEAGSIGSCPAVINAVVDALKHKKVRHVDMPATPERLWRLLNAA